MTTELLKGVAFKLISHTSYTDEYIAVYESTNFAPTITVKVFTKRKNAFETTKSRRVYYFNGKAYRSKESLVKAINEYQNKQENGNSSTKNI